MKDEESGAKGSDGVFGKRKYKLWVIAAILLLAFWSMFTGSITLTLNRISSSSSPFNALQNDFDVLEVEEREKVVRQMWDVYTQSRGTRLPKFWQHAFEAAYEDLIADSAAVRDAAVSEIAKMSFRSAPASESLSAERETEKETDHLISNGKEKTVRKR
ncbi:unnamed protein product [Cuscuta europaea]|uniref:Uncharacterized protein n=1 Tax=Cuscuta europaea TaxID=41803 RepID=A0A9P1E4D6_CUSEU|nr:unnamed protein product [Cuscuta europaea]